MTAAPSDATRSGLGAGREDPSLAQYFRWASAHPLLRPEEQRQLAWQIRRAEEEEWVCLLSFPACVPYLTSQLEELLGRRGSSRTRALLRIARSCQTRGGGGRARKLAALRAAALPLARRLRARDCDRLLLDRAVRFARSLALLDAACIPELRRPVRSAAYRDWLRSLRNVGEISLHGRHRMVLANLRLVVAIARHYGRPGTPLIDLIQEGNLGLMKAVDRFDVAKGFRFSTYATWWIRHAVRRALFERERTVRLPVHVTETWLRANREDAAVWTRTGREPSDDELAVRLGIRPAEVRAARFHGGQRDVSLDHPLFEEGGTLVDRIVEREAPSPLDELLHARTCADVRDLLDRLSPREALVLRLRFGFEQDEELTLRQIGECLRLSRERIRQLECQALERARRRIRETTCRSRGGVEGRGNDGRTPE